MAEQRNLRDGGGGRIGGEEERGTQGHRTARGGLKGGAGESLEQGLHGGLPLASVHAGKKKPRGKKKAPADRGTPPVGSQKRPRGRRGAAVYAGWMPGQAQLGWVALGQKRKGRACPFWKKKRT